jgi:hypothetical protein
MLSGWWQTLVASGLLPLLIVALVTWLSYRNTTKQLEYQRREDRARRKEAVYQDCIRYLCEGRCKPIMDTTKLDYEDFLGRMASLQYAVPWMIMVASLSPGKAQSDISSTADMLKKYLDECRAEITELMPKPIEILPKKNPIIGGYDPTCHIVVIEGHDLPRAIDSALDAIVKHSKNELCRNEPKGIS